MKRGGAAVFALAMPVSMKLFANFNSNMDNKIFEAIIVGGSYAGLSAAMALGRSLRDVLIIDSGLPCNWIRASSPGERRASSRGETFQMRSGVGTRRKRSIAQ